MGNEKMTVFSHSKIECFNMCPHKYKLSYIDNMDTLPTDDASNALIIGSALHLGIEKGIDAGIELYKQSFPILENSHYDEIIKLENVIPKVDKFLNRDKAEFEIKLATDDFVGYVDYVEHINEKEVKIYDFKYSNAIDRYMMSDQLHLYKYFYERLYPMKTVSELGFIFVPKTGIRPKKTETVADFRKRLVEELKGKDAQLINVAYDANKVINFFERMKHVIEATEYPKNETNFCHFCQFYNFCQNGVDCDLIHKSHRF